MNERTDNTTDMPRLKPCPFCGSVAATAWKSKTAGGWAVECDECLTVVIPQSENERQVRDGWNRRAA